MGCSGSKPETNPTSTSDPTSGPKSNPNNVPASSPSKVTDTSKTTEPSTSSKVPTVKDLAQVVGEGGGKDTHHVKNIFAKKLEFDANFTPPVHEKSPKETQFILKALQNNFVFETMAPRELEPLVLAFEKSTASTGEEIIKQGSEGDYFYILEQGQCAFIVNGVQVGVASMPGLSFGELALLYTAPRAATVKALETPTNFFRVDQTTFRFILQNQTQKGFKAKYDLLRKIEFLAGLGEEDMNNLASAMTPRPFNKGDFLMKKGDAADFFYVIQEGSVQVTDIQVGDAKYEDLTLAKGDYVGERALVTGEPRAASVICLTEGMAFGIDKATFETVLGKLNDAILRSQDLRQLSGIKVIRESHWDQKTLVTLARRFTDKTFQEGDIIVQEGQKVDAALYFPRSGLTLELTNAAGTRKEYLEVGGYFGDDQLLADTISGQNGPGDSTMITAAYTVKVTHAGACGLLTLAECRKVVDTLFIGKKKVVEQALMKITMSDLTRHSILGAGTFGQVWLVSLKKEDNKKGYALKIQSKYELVKDGQAKAVTDEKNIMSKLHHPFIIRLHATFQDKKFVYMLLDLVQGGELFSLLHRKTGDGVPEANAKFYAAAIHDGLAFMHRLSIVYRDLKPENILIGADGYPVIVDFGFAKYVKDKTYTLCGTPLYLAPEVILNRGHNHSADHWSLGVLTFEMIAGDTPFYKPGMEQMDLFRAVVKGSFDVPSTLSKEAASIVSQFLIRNPAKRLGNLANGEDGIYNHPWFDLVNFDELRLKKTVAPHKPNVKSPMDTDNFDDWSHLQDKTLGKFPPVKPAEEKIFENF